MQNSEKKLATIQRRGIAFVIDDIIVSSIFLAIIWDMLPSNLSFLELSLVMNQYVLYLITIKIIYHTYFVWKFRATLGKMTMKIEVLSTDYTNIALPQSFNRAIFRIVSEIVFYLGFFLALIDKNRQTLHDKTAKTVVVNV